MADDWTRYGDPWSYRREKHAVKVTFADQTVIAMPYDMPILGYHTDNIGTLRLWQCEPEQELDFDAFNARISKRRSRRRTAPRTSPASSTPNDETREGKAPAHPPAVCSLQRVPPGHSAGLPLHPRQGSGAPHEAAAIQLNDTHPALSIPELIRLLMAEGLDFDSAVTVAGRPSPTPTTPSWPRR